MSTYTHSVIWARRKKKGAEEGEKGRVGRYRALRKINTEEHTRVQGKNGLSALSKGSPIEKKKRKTGEGRRDGTGRRRENQGKQLWAWGLASLQEIFFAVDILGTLV